MRAWSVPCVFVALLFAACAGDTSPRAPAPRASRPEVAAEPTAVEATLAPVTPEPIALEPAEPARLEIVGDSTSLGSPTFGDVRDAVSLPDHGPGFRFNPRRRREARFGTVEMVRALVDAARVVREELPGGELVINDLGFEDGGPIPGHGSHQAGRDVDTLFYLLDDNDDPIASVGAPLDPDGRGVDFKDLARPDDDVSVHLDVPRTWAFVRALIEDPNVALQRIFVAEHLRTILLAHARDTSVDAVTLRRFQEMTCQPSYPHDDHFHFRFFCTLDDLDAGCRDSRPMYPWRRAQLREGGKRVRMAGPRRRRAPITTAEEARAAAGPLDPAVTQWLERREAWMQNPHPGRRYCR